MFTVKEVAEKLRLDPETVRQRIVSGEIAAIRAGSGKTSPYRVTEEALADYLKRQRVKVTT